MNSSNMGAEFVAYVFGDLPDEEMARVDAWAKRDPEVRAQIALIRAGSGWRNAEGKRFGRILRAGAAILLVAVGVGAAWAIFTPKPLLSDTFDDSWFDSRLWLPPPELGANRGIKEQNGYLKLVNRGYLVTRAEFTTPLSVSFDWSWSELGLNPVNADHLVVVLRTTGEASLERPFEAKDGVMVRFNPWTGRVYIDAEPNHEHYSATVPGGVKLSAEAWHHIRITDDGLNVAVFMSGPAVGDQNPTVPILEAQCPLAGAGGHIAIYNREELAGIPHESYVDNVVVMAQ